MLKITIIGMGLIGTSLGIALRQNPQFEVFITGYDADQRATRTARSRLAIDREARHLHDAIHEAQLVVLATPARAMQSVLSDLAPLLSAGTVVTDLASTKAQICAWAAELLPAEVAFVGGHPMAGREQHGAEAAEADLFRDAIYCLTPAPDTHQDALALVESLVLAIGARPYYIDPVEHDALVAGISHLPFVLSRVLVEVTSRSPAWKEMSALAATGFRDVSRLASGDPQMHRDICLTNSAALTRWINEAIDSLANIRDAVEQANAEHLTTLFTDTQQTRDSWLDSNPRLRPGEASFEDTPQVERGVLGFRVSSRRNKKKSNFYILLL